MTSLAQERRFSLSPPDSVIDSSPVFFLNIPEKKKKLGEVFFRLPSTTFTPPDTYLSLSLSLSSLYLYTGPLVFFMIGKEDEEEEDPPPYRKSRDSFVVSTGGAREEGRWRPE